MFSVLIKPCICFSVSENDLARSVNALVAVLKFLDISDKWVLVAQLSSPHFSPTVMIEHSLGSLLCY